MRALRSGAGDVDLVTRSSRGPTSPVEGAGSSGPRLTKVADLVRPAPAR